MVGSANGRSITESTRRLPGKSSRVSTHATNSPKTRLISVTPVEIVSVTRNDSSAALEVIASQNACQPPPADCHTIAASGSSTMTLSQIDAAPTRSDVVPYRPPKRLGARPALTVVGEFGPGRLRIGFDGSRHPVACL